MFPTGLKPQFGRCERVSCSLPSFPVFLVPEGRLRYDTSHRVSLAGIKTVLTIYGKSDPYCDGLSRRSFLKIGGLAMGGVGLPQLLRAESQSGAGRSHKSIIMIFLSGGPPHQDMFDLKMTAPSEIRGEFTPISTAVPGFQICELLPQMAQTMDRMSVIRSLVGSEGRHAAFQCLTGKSVGRQG